MKLEKLSKKLAKHLKYYTDDPSKRCKTSNGGCRYSGVTLDLDTKGCMIGSMLTAKDRLVLDQLDLGGSSIKAILTDFDDIIEGFKTYRHVCSKHEKLKDVAIPKWMFSHKVILQNFQNLHDIDLHWVFHNGKAIRFGEQGKRFLNRIIIENDLVRSDFAFALESETTTE
jgi:hypothetical protein